MQPESLQINTSGNFFISRLVRKLLSVGSIFKAVDIGFNWFFGTVDSHQNLWYIWVYFIFETFGFTLINTLSDIYANCFG